MSDAGMAAILWLLLAVGLFVLETVTYQLICIWFSAGALLGMVAALLGAPLWLQMLVFLLSSVLVLYFGRPVLRERMKVKKTATNADLVIGQVGIVRETVDNDLQTGRVTAGGLDWTARSTESGVSIPEGSRVKAVRIEGVKLIVEPLEIKELAVKE